MMIRYTLRKDFQSQVNEHIHHLINLLFFFYFDEDAYELLSKQILIIRYSTVSYSHYATYQILN